MARADTITLDSPTGAALRVLRLRPDAGRRPDAVLLIQHGLAEHGGRYRRLGVELSEAGLAVFAHDHRGHGSTTAVDAPLRRFATRGGVAKVLRDTHAVRHHAEAEHPGVPVVMLGHSMGALVALNYARRFGDGLSGLLAWNAGAEFGWRGRAAVAALRVEQALKGSDVASAAFARATFETWARQIPDRRTAADWLTHDAAIVDRYLDDPLCGWTPTVSLAGDIVEMVRTLDSVAELSAIPHRLPVHVLGGSEDPSTDEGKTTGRLATRLREAGLRTVEAEIVTGARHETLNEIEPMRGQAVTALRRFVASCAAKGAVTQPAPALPE